MAREDETRAQRRGGADRRPMLGLAAAALALIAVPAVDYLAPRSDHVIEEGPEPYRTAAQQIDTFWRRSFARQFPRADDRYFTPRVVFAADSRRRRAELGDYAGYYAEDAETIRIVVDEPASFVFFVIAHEFGHHAQAVSGLSEERDRMMRRSWSDEERRRIVMRYELQAECLAGVWAFEAAQTQELIDRSDVDKWRMAVAFGADSPTHGAARQRRRWFDAGYARGRATDCDTFSVPWDRL